MTVRLSALVNALYLRHNLPRSYLYRLVLLPNVGQQHVVHHIWLCFDGAPLDELCPQVAEHDQVT